jgi:hypothetical protein
MKCAKHSKEAERVTACLLSHIYKLKEVVTRPEQQVIPHNTEQKGSLLLSPTGAFVQFQFVSSVTSVRNLQAKFFLCKCNKEGISVITVIVVSWTNMLMPKANTLKALYRHD